MVSGRASREARRRKIEEARLRVAREQATHRAVRVGGLVIVVVVAIMAGFLYWDGHHTGTASADTTATPGNLGLDNSVKEGEDGAGVKVVIYEDFQSPDSADFETTNRDQLAAWVKSGDVQVQYRPIALLDDKSADSYSTRALNAVGAVVNAGPDSFVEFHNLLFDNQPDEGGAGLTDDQLVEYATKAGADEATVRTIVSAQTYKTWTAEVTGAATAAGITTTPAVQVNGTTLKKTDKKSFVAAVKKAIAKAAEADTTVSEK